MSKEYQTKEMTAAPPGEYHFPGGKEYEPCTVMAGNRAEAEKQWEKSRVAIIKPIKK